MSRTTPNACQRGVVHVRREEDVDGGAFHEAVGLPRRGRGPELAAALAAHCHQILRGLAEVVMREAAGQGLEVRSFVAETVRARGRPGIQTPCAPC